MLAWGFCGYYVSGWVSSVGLKGLLLGPSVLIQKTWCVSLVGSILILAPFVFFLLSFLLLFSSLQVQPRVSLFSLILIISLQNSLSPQAHCFPGSLVMNEKALHQIWYQRHQVLSELRSFISSDLTAVLHLL